MFDSNQAYVEFHISDYGRIFMRFSLTQVLAASVISSHVQLGALLLPWITVNTGSNTLDEHDAIYDIGRIIKDTNALNDTKAEFDYRVMYAMLIIASVMAFTSTIFQVMYAIDRTIYPWSLICSKLLSVVQMTVNVVAIVFFYTRIMDHLDSVSAVDATVHPLGPTLTSISIFLSVCVAAGVLYHDYLNGDYKYSYSYRSVPSSSVRAPPPPVPTSSYPQQFQHYNNNSNNYQRYSYFQTAQVQQPQGSPSPPYNLINR